MSIDHYENFPVASMLCPPRLRPAVAAIYWYARTADDIADEGHASAAERLAALADYRTELHAAAAGAEPSMQWPKVFVPLKQTFAKHALPLALLEDLLSAFEQDVEKTSYADRGELLDYCRRSANPIGRLLLHLYGVDSPPALQQSDAICTALQLANFWQDLSIDLARGRLYLPLSDVRRMSASSEQLLAREDSAAARRLIEEEVRWARELMLSGAPLAHQLRGRIGWELRLVVQGGLRILEKIATGRFNSVVARPRLHWFDVPLMLWRALRMKPTAESLPKEAQL